MNHSSTTSPTTTRLRRAATLSVALIAALLLGASGAAFGVNTADFSGGGSSHVSGQVSTIPSPIGSVPCFAGQLADRWGADTELQPRCVAAIGDFITVSHQTARLGGPPAVGSPCFMTPPDWNAAADGPLPTC